MDVSQTAPLAVLIDADNTSARYAEAVLDEAAKYGRPTVKRAYGDWTGPRLNGWKDELNRRAIQPIQQFAYTTGKNSTDSSLIIDAMDLLYAGHVDGFVLVSSDSDFTRLATRLQESGHPVFGIGRKATPLAFQQACTQFIWLENIVDPAAETSPKPERGESEGEGDTPTDEPVAPDLQKLLTTAIGNTGTDNGWSGLGAVGQYLARSYAAFDPRTYGHKRLSDLVKAQSYVEVRSGDGPTGVIWVRTRQPVKKAAKKSAGQSPGQSASRAAGQGSRRSAAKKSESAVATTET